MLLAPTLLGAFLRPPCGDAANVPVPITSFRVLPDEGRRLEPRWMEFLPTGKYIAVQLSANKGADGELRVYDTKSAQLSLSRATPHGGRYGSQRVFSSQLTDTIGFVDGDTLRLLALPPPKVVPQAEQGLRPNPKSGLELGKADALWVTKDGKSVYSVNFADEKYSLTAWTLETGATRKVLSGSSWAARDFDVNSSATRFALSVQRQFGIRQEDVEVWTLDGEKPVRTVIPQPTVPQRLDPMSLKLSPSGKVVAVGYGDGSVGFWASDTGNLLHHVRLPARFTIAALAFDPTENYLACGSLDRGGQENLFIVKIKSGQIIVRMTVDAMSVSKVCFSPGGDRIATFGGSGTVMIWDATKLLKQEEN